MNKIKLLFYCILTLILTSCENKGSNKSEKNIEINSNYINYHIVNIYPHDTSAYTQGLIFLNNKLYESTGLWKKSKISEVDIKTAKSIKTVNIYDAEIFGEGITILNNKIYQLTWKNNRVFVYDINTFQKVNEFKWNEEGWGITHIHDTLIISTGSSNLYYVNPIDFKVLKIIPVTRNNFPVVNLNELEYANEYIYANEYGTDSILKINPHSGIVEGILDMRDLLKKSGLQYDLEKYQTASGNVLNGVAFNSKNNTFFVTGKLWPALFEIKF